MRSRVQRRLAQRRTSAVVSLTIGRTATESVSRAAQLPPSGEGKRFAGRKT